MKTQYDRLEVLLTRPGGATSLELVRAVPSLCIHKRISFMALEMGWKITKTKKGKFTNYVGIPPRKQSKYVPKTVWVK